MKSHRIILIFLAMAFLFYLAGWSTAEAQVIQMKFAHYAEESSSGSLGGEAVCRKGRGADQRAGEDRHLPG